MHDHIVCCDEKTRQLHIYRLDADARRTLLTTVDLPRSSGWTSEVEAFAKALGENLLMDSPTVRKLLGL